jgi:cell shape-determining protein MreD
MSKIYIHVGIFSLFIGLFLLDLGLGELAFWKNLLILSALLLNYILSIRSESTFLVIFVLAGLCYDWYNKGLLGLSSLVLVISLYFFYLLYVRFRGNRFVLYLVNYIFNFIVIITFNGFNIESSILIQSSVGALIHTTLSIFWWEKSRVF